MLSMGWACFGIVLAAIGAWILFQFDPGASVVVRDVMAIALATICMVAGVVLVALAKPRKDG